LANNALPERIKMEREEKNFEAEELLSRREFLEKMVEMGMGLGITLLSSTSILSLTGRLPFPKERFLVTLEGGEKVGMVLGIHEMPGPGGGPSPRVTLLEEKDLWFPVGALFLDACDNYLDRQTRGRLASIFLNADKMSPFFSRALFAYAIKENIPIILGDQVGGVSAARRAISSSTLNCFSAILSETGLVLKKIDSKISRRKFLKSVALVGALGFVHFSTPDIIEICREIGVRPDSEIGRDFQAIISDIFHPENWVVVMRNIVWALKIRDFYERGEIPPVINVIGGSAHRFFDFFFRYPEVAIKYWKRFNYKAIATGLAGGNPEWVYKSWIFYPQQPEGKIITHERLLKELV